MPNTSDFHLNKRAVKYNPANAYWLSCCSLLAHRGASEVAQAAQSWGLGRVDSISRSGTQCFVASNDRVVVVAFRGTETDELQDVLADLDMRLVKANGGKAHAGFKRAYAAVRSRVRAKVQAHRNNGQTVWITGHSLGGAIAVFAATDLLQQGVKANGIYTFGAPQVGDRAFAGEYGKSLGKRHFRLVQVNDPVPGVLPPPLEHVGQAIYIASRKRLTLKYRRSRNVINQVMDLGSAPSSHPIAGYVEAMQKNFDVDPFDTPNRVIREKAVVTPKQVKRTVTQGARTAKRKVESEVSKGARSVRRGARRAGRNLEKLFE